MILINFPFTIIILGAILFVVFYMFIPAMFNIITWFINALGGS